MKYEISKANAERFRDKFNAALLKQVEGTGLSPEQATLQPVRGLIRHLDSEGVSDTYRGNRMGEVISHLSEMKAHRLVKLIAVDALKRMDEAETKLLKLGRILESILPEREGGDR
jgi:hypothetical protein